MRQRGGLGTRLGQYIKHVYSVHETYRTVLSKWCSQTPFFYEQDISYLQLVTKSVNAL